MVDKRNRGIYDVEKLLPAEEPPEPLVSRPCLRCGKKFKTIKGKRICKPCYKKAYRDPRSRMRSDKGASNGHGYELAPPRGITWFRVPTGRMR